MLIDLDPHNAASTWLATLPVGKGVFSLFTEAEAANVDDLIQPTATPNLSLLGSNGGIGGIEKYIFGKPDAGCILREKLRPLEGKFDYVLMDCPPTFGRLSVNALVAVDEVLIPVEAHALGLTALAQVLKTIELVKKKLNPVLGIAGILACRVDRKSKHASEIVVTLRSKFPETCKTFIRESTRLKECLSIGKPITEHAPTSPGCEDYRGLAQEIIEREEGSKHANVANA